MWMQLLIHVSNAMLVKQIPICKREAPGGTMLDS